MASDLTGTINQSTADKLISSVNYPFVLFDQTWPFTGRNAPGDYLYSTAEVTALLQRAVGVGSLAIAAPTNPDSEFLSAVLNGTSPVIESAKAYLRALAEATPSQPVTGPDAAAVQQILNGGVVALAALQGIQFKAHLAWLQVGLDRAPAVSIGSPQIGIQNLEVEVGATGELWWYHPTLHCHRLCTQWDITWGWDRIASITMRGIRLQADAHANTSVSGTKILVTGVFDRLRLDYDILRDIPLEGFANGVLGNKPLFVYDAAQLVTTVPVLGSRFGVASVDLPASRGSITVGATIAKLGR